jgi:hypothetical protein
MGTVTYDPARMNNNACHILKFAHLYMEPIYCIYTANQSEILR